jgi:hypothetical protein
MEISVFQGFALRWVNGWAFGPNTFQQYSRKKFCLWESQPE